MSKEIKKYDKKRNLVYYKNWSGEREEWIEYDKNNNIIHYKNSLNFEYWKEYDKNNNMIHYKHSNGYEEYAMYNKNNKLIYVDYGGIEYYYKYNDGDRIIISKKEFQEIEYLSRKKISRFELMDI